MTPEPLLSADLFSRVQAADIVNRSGRITRVTGTLIEGVLPRASVGSMWSVTPREGRPLMVEVVGFRETTTLMMPYGTTHGIAPGQRLTPIRSAQTISVGPELLGRVVNAMGEPIDDLAPLSSTVDVPLFAKPPNPMHRQVIDRPFPVGVRTIDALTTLGRGQRVGLMAGSGVGKSVLLGMMARGQRADVVVLGLIGERGREVRHFLERELDPETLARCVIVVATSDEPALTRMRGAYAATAIAEFFRDRGDDVLLLMDSITRFALAGREIGLAAGEPPTTNGYTPSVFASIPPLLERAGPGSKGQGSVTAIYSVLAEGEDMEDPIVDHVRSVVDGHIVLSRRLANKNHFPAIDVLSSLSRVMAEVVEDQAAALAAAMRDDLAHLRDAEDLVRLGAYVPGASPELDAARSRAGAIEGFLRQSRRQVSTMEETHAQLEEIYS